MLAIAKPEDDLLLPRCQPMSCQHAVSKASLNSSVHHLMQADDLMCRWLVHVCTSFAARSRSPSCSSISLMCCKSMCLPWERCSCKCVTFCTWRISQCSSGETVALSDAACCHPCHWHPVAIHICNVAAANAQRAHMLYMTSSLRCHSHLYYYVKQ